MSNATQFDLSRPTILERYRQRIAKGERTKLVREERDCLTLIFLDRLVELNHRNEDTEEAIEQLCLAEIALLEEGYPKKSIANQYLPNYTRLIREAIANDAIKLTDQNSFDRYWRKRNAPEVSGATRTHYALEYLKYDQEQYASDRSETNENNNDRQDNPADVELDPYLEQVQKLVYADEPELMAIAIAAVTGRRHIEVVAQGQFSETKHPYLITFAGQAKKRDDQPNESFDILTLIPAGQAMDLIDRFRAHPEVQPLLGLDDEHPEVQKFHARVNRRVEKIFGRSGLVPVLPGFKSVSIHRLRALWGAIAYHFFAPGQKNPQRFLQHYLGHVSNEMRSSPNAPVTGHYFHYRLWRNGKELLAKGVKLPANGPLPDSMLTGDEEQKLQHGEPVVLTAPPGLETTASPTEASVSQEVVDDLTTELEDLPIHLPIHPQQYDRAQRILNQIQPQAALVDQVLALLDWVETHWNETKTDKAQDLAGIEMADKPTTPPSPEQQSMTQAFIKQAESVAWMCQEIDRLREQVATLQAECNHLRSTQPQSVQPDSEVEQLRTQSAVLASQNAQLHTQLSQLQTEHNQLLALIEPFKQILGGQGQPISTGSQPRETTKPNKSATKSVPTQPHATVTPKQIDSSARNSGSTSEASIGVEDLKAQIELPQTNDSRYKAKMRAASVLEAIFDWAASHPDQAVAVGGTFLEKQFGINRDAANEFAEANSEVIHAYYQRFGIQKPRTNNRDRAINLDQFRNFVVDQTSSASD